MICSEPFIYEDFDETLHELNIEIVELNEPIALPDFDETHCSMLFQMSASYDQTFFEWLHNYAN